MDHESRNYDVPSASVESRRGPLVRRRRNLALATAAVLASASSTSAFSPSSSAHPLACYASHQQQSSFKEESKRPSRRSSRSYHGQSLHVLNMVSFMETSLTTTTDTRKRRGPPPPSRASGRSIRKVPTKKESRKTIEIDLQPDFDYDFLGVDDEYSIVSTPPSSSQQQLGVGNDNGSSSSSSGEELNRHNNRPVPEIDSEILYEGITRAPPSASTQNRVQKGAVTATSSGKPTNSNNNRPAASSSKKSSSSAPSAKKSKSKSSTMPGFIKDAELDLQIANANLRRLPSSQHKKLTRSMRSKSAKLKRRKTNSEVLYKKSASVPDSLLDYVHEIHAVERVTPKEEKELGTKTQEAIRLQKLHEDLEAKYGREPSDDEWCAAAGKLNIVALQEAIEDGMEAKNQLVASNLRMVQRVVNLYIRNGLGSEYNAGDLMQDGTMALIRAAEKYEPDRGFRFSTYAMYWIRSAVKRSQTSQSRIVTVPQRIHETHKRITKHQARLRKELGRDATKDELAAACDISITQLDRCRKAMSQVTFSLDAELENGHKPNNGGSRKDTMYDIVAGQVDETEFERTQRLFMKDHLIGTLRRYLTPHEVDLLLLRYGLMDDRALPKGMSGPLTIAEVSKLVGLKPDKVRRIIINSQKQLKHLMKEWEDFEFELA
ncbi:hypothetical protein ACHAXR_005342 [Thalassiosira sp. AJA248-18]